MTHLLTIAVAAAAWLGVLTCIVAVCAAAARADRRDGRMRTGPASSAGVTPDRILAARTPAPSPRRARALSH